MCRAGNHVMALQEDEEQSREDVEQCEEAYATLAGGSCYMR